MVGLGWFLVEKAADRQGRVSQSKRDTEKTSQIFCLQARGRLWGTGEWGRWGGGMS